MYKVRLKPTGKPKVKKQSGPTVEMDKKSFIRFATSIKFCKSDNLWATYVFKDRGGYISEEEQLCVEAYCCGFLTYYEHIARNRVYTFKEIYFEWLQKGRGTKGFTLVNVYLDPPPVKKLLAKKSGYKSYGSKSDGKKTIQAAGGVSGMQEFSDPPVGPHPPPPPMG